MYITFSLWKLKLRLNRSSFIILLVMNYLLPVAFALLVARTVSVVDAPRMMLSAFMVAALFSTMRLPAFTLTSDRVFGTRDLLATARITKARYLGANALDAALFSLLCIPSMIVTSFVLGVAVPLSFEYWLVLLLYVLSLHGAGLLLASWASEVPVFLLGSNLVVAILVAVSSIYYPIENAPDFLEPLAQVLPTSLAAEAAVHAYEAEELQYGRLIGLMFWAATLNIVGYIAFPWRQQSAYICKKPIWNIR